MEIAHIAIWTERLEELRDFYVRYVGGVSNGKYTNPDKGFESYFVAFGGGCRLELMRRTDIQGRNSATQLGLCHLAFELGSREEVLTLTERLRSDNHPILGEPRITGDGYFESVAADPDGNQIELTCKQTP